MLQPRNFNIQEENDLRKIVGQVKRNYLLFLSGVIIALVIAYLVNIYSIPAFKISASILIKQENKQQSNINDYINTNLFGSSQNVQNELEVIKSSPVLQQTVKNLDLPVTYYVKENFLFREHYKNTPFKVLYRNDHVQPLNIRFRIKFHKNNSFTIYADVKNAKFWHFEKNKLVREEKKWKLKLAGRLNELIETPEMSFIVTPDSSNLFLLREGAEYYFSFNSIPLIAEYLKSKITFESVSNDASIIQLSFKSESIEKGEDILNGILDVYSKQDLDKKNHLATITIDYINQQLGIITDSLNQAEQRLQSFRSTNQVLDLTSQASGIAEQYQNLQNEMAELLTRKRYFDNLENNLSKENEITNIAIPSSLGIEDQELNRQMADLISAQTQRSTLIENNQERNPLVRKLTIEINNLRKVISENISNARKTTEIAIDEMEKRIGKIEAQISRMPNTERQLIGFERKYQLNEAIFNYLMEKQAEANITKASNLPDNEIIEPAKMVGSGPVSPNKTMNLVIAVMLGLLVPFGFLQLKSMTNDKIENHENIERITDIPILGKIFHNTRKTTNVVFQYPGSSISESYRTLRTNLEYYVRGGHKKVIIVTSSIEKEGKSFNALNIAMSYAQFGRKTILVDFDLRKRTSYFNVNGDDLIGMSSYLIDKVTLDDVIINSPHEKLDYIPSGPIPPNPVELIGYEKTANLIANLKEKYDYIIIDTPPLAQVTDGYLLLEYADVKIMIVRYNYTVKGVLSQVLKDLKQKNIHNLCIVLNDNKVLQDQYGYGTGYKKQKV